MSVGGKLTTLSRSVSVIFLIIQYILYFGVIPFTQLKSKEFLRLKSYAL